MNLPVGGVSCYAVIGGKITDPTFTVRVPVLGIDADITNEGVTAGYTIVAKNCTDYRVSHHGKIHMGATDYEVTASVIKAAGPVPTHGHIGKEPFDGTDVTYSELNDIDVSVGDLMIGLFLDGDSNNLAIIHIPHKVPIGGEVNFD